MNDWKRMNLLASLRLDTGEFRAYYRLWEPREEFQRLLLLIRFWEALWDSSPTVVLSEGTALLDCNGVIVLLFHPSSSWLLLEARAFLINYSAGFRVRHSSG